MSTPLNGYMTGTFTSAGTALDIEVPFGAQEFRLINLSSIGSAAAATPVMRGQWVSGMLDGSGYYNLKTNGAATVAIETTTLTNGFSVLLGGGDIPPGPAIVNAAGGITQAAGAVLTSATTYPVGSIIRVYNSTGMLQIAGMDFTVTAENPGVTNTLGYLNSAGFAAPATANTIRLIPADPIFYPRRRYITGITQAAQAVITLSVTHGYTVGQLVRIMVDPAFGMFEINGLLGTITAINAGTNTITVNINSTAFTAFAFPTSAIAAAGVTFPQVVPVGEAATVPYQNLLDDATDNRAFRGIRIGTTVQTTGERYQWIAQRGIAV